MARTGLRVLWCAGVLAAGLCWPAAGRDPDQRQRNLLAVQVALEQGLACLQRGYFDNASDYGCAKTSTVLVTIVAGPLNYVGANPRIHRCNVPQPSK